MSKAPESPMQRYKITFRRINESLTRLGGFGTLFGSQCKIVKLTVRFALVDVPVHEEQSLQYWMEEAGCELQRVTTAEDIDNVEALEFELHTARQLNERFGGENRKLLASNNNLRKALIEIQNIVKEQLE